MEMVHSTHYEHMAKGAKSPDVLSNVFLSHFSLKWAGELNSYRANLQFLRKMTTSWDSQVRGLLLPQTLRTSGRWS